MYIGHSSTRWSTCSSNHMVALLVGLPNWLGDTLHWSGTMWWLEGWTALGAGHLRDTPAATGYTGACKPASSSEGSTLMRSTLDEQHHWTQLYSLCAAGRSMAYCWWLVYC